MVLDTYEDSGESRDRVEQHILVALRRCPWLRVVVVGQQVPTCTNVPWASFAAHPVVLQPPSIDDWFDYRVKNKPGDTHLDREFIEKLLSATAGQLGTVAQVLGAST